MLPNKRSYCNEKPRHHIKEESPLATTRESPCAATKTQHSKKKKKKKKNSKIKNDLGSQKLNMDREIQESPVFI